MIIRFIQKTELLRRVIYVLADRRAKGLIAVFHEFIGSSAKIIDVGAGVCNITERLNTEGYETMALDVVNLSMVKGLDPIIYDGQKIPFKDNVFSVGLVITVLHHITNQENLLSEAMRVAQRVIIMEDVYKSKLRRWITFIFDSLFNLEFRGHPHSNRTDEGWKQLFKDKKYKLVAEKSFSSYLVFSHKIYVLERV